MPASYYTKLACLKLSDRYARLWPMRGRVVCPPVCPLVTWFFSFLVFFCHVLIFIMRPEHFCASRPRRAVVVASSGMRLLINCCCACCWSFASKTLNFINTYMRDMATSGPTATATATFVFLGHTKTIMKFIFSLYLFWFFLYSFLPSALSLFLFPPICLFLKLCLVGTSSV